MRIALLTQVVPNPPDAGPKIKTHYTLRTLAERHELELISFARSAEEAQAAKELGDWCERVTVIPIKRRKSHEPLYLARGWAVRMPFLVARDYRAAFATAVEERLKTGSIDVLYADQVSMAQYLFPSSTERAAAPYNVFDAHNAVWNLIRQAAPRQALAPQRAGAAVEWRLMRRFEGQVCRSADLTFAVSNGDLAALQNAAGGPFGSAVVPIGIEARDAPVFEPRPDATRLVSVATMHYPPNAQAIRWFRDAVWPVVRERDPALRVEIVGTRPPDDLVAWGRQDERVTVHGYLPDDALTPLFEEALAVIVPLQAGSGIRVKILEAMARGIPVVSTSIGAEGLEVVPGEHLLIADEPDDFSTAIAQLAANLDERRRIAEAARTRALHRYDWRACNLPILETIEALAPRADKRQLNAAIA